MRKQAELITHSLTERDRVVTVVAKEEGPCALLGIEADEDGRTFKHGVDLDQSLLLGALLHANMVASDVADLEGSGPAEERQSASEVEGRAGSHAHQTVGLPGYESTS